MDYKEKYKEALNKAQEELQCCGTLDCDVARQIFRFFPELKENGDERISREITEFLVDFNNGEYEIPNENTIDSWLSWLEKQGEHTKFMESIQIGDKITKTESGNLVNLSQLERVAKPRKQKPTDNIEPKFRNGQWIVWEDRCYKVNYNGCGYELVDQNGSTTSSDYEDIDKNAHIWDVTKDAKDNDILATEYFIFIFKNVDSDNGVHYYCHYEIDQHEDDEQFGVALPQSLMGRVDNNFSHYSPASKEQRDLLFQKMKETGYEWDAEKKELKKIEQNPTYKVEPKFKIGDWVVFNNCHQSIYQVEKIENGYYILRHTHGGTFRVCILHDENLRLWTIEDAKDGDVLYFDDDTIVMFKNLYNSSTFHSHCHIEYGLFGINSDDLPDWWESEGFHPSTKEQRDILFQKIKEVGYEWDSKMKQLIKL